MKQFLTRVWQFYSTHTLVRHALTALVAAVIVEGAPFLTNWAKDFLDDNTVEAVAVGAIGAGVRWAQIRLEVLIHAYFQGPTQ